MKKNCFALAVGLLLLVLFPLTAAAGQNDVKLSINNQLIYVDVNPVISQGRTLVPLRGIFEGMGAAVEWDAATKTITATKGDVVMKLVINNTTAVVNGTPVKLDVPAKIVNGRTMVPVRFISESLGAQVDWDSATKIIAIRDATVQPVNYEALYDAMKGSRNSRCQFDFDEHITFNGQSGDMRLTGSAEVYGSDMHFDGNLSMNILTVNKTSKIETVLKDGTIYTRMDDQPWVTAEMPLTQEEWTEMSVSEDAFTALIRSVPVKQEEGVLNGEPVTVYTIYTGKAELTQLFNNMYGGDLNDLLESLGGDSSVSDLNYLITCYVNEKDQLVKEDFRLNISMMVSGVQMSVQGTGGATFSDFGEAFDITAPVL
ncbi:MAG: copper amine oxidase N-terminal domain-containing protein [Bacillota bacterium]